MYAVEITLEDHAIMPTKATVGSSGFDLYSNEGLIIPPGERRLVHTGVKIGLQPGLEAQVRPRSGLALKQGITVLNAPGTIDSDYRGEISVILLNTDQQEHVVIRPGDRIAQIVIASVEHNVQLSLTEELSKTIRGEQGFGSSGV